MANPAPDDATLVRRAQAGEEAAFRVLVARHKDRSYALALRLTGSAPDAEEVAQDAFVRAWRALPSFRFEAAFGTWLHRIVARLALDRRERLRTRSRFEAQDGDTPDVAAPPKDEGGTLEWLLDTLTERARAAVVLYYYEDRSVAEVAHILGAPENTVKTLLARARDTMKEAWNRAEARQR
jgi:RNA polymerase sigma-70 factor (ECF subfamily)